MKMQTSVLQVICLEVFVNTVLVGLDCVLFHSFYHMLSQTIKIHHVHHLVYILSVVQDKLRFDPESEIATTGLRVSLICPVSIPS